jgi:NADPH-dependent ferric siderophore reductase
MSPARSRVSVTVLRTVTLTPHMRRLVFGGPDLTEWLKTDGVQEPAAWVKVFPAGRYGRAYTIRRIDSDAGTVEIDFVLHGDESDSGSVSDWARMAQCGDQAEIAGPKSGGFRLLADSQWLWMAADASALPAALSILESLPYGIHTNALIVQRDTTHRQPVRSSSMLHMDWRPGHQLAQRLNPDDPLLIAIDELKGPGQVWVAGELDWVKSWRLFWSSERRLEAQRIAAKGYWKEGERDHRDRGPVVLEE